MPIVGFNFEKVSVEKKNIIVEKVQIKSNISITDVKEQKLPTGKTKMEGLRFNFDFNLDYEPKLGNINLQGHIFYTDDPKTLKNIFKNYKKDKSISSDLTALIINTILLRSSVKALNLAQEVNLPPHIPLPRITQKVDPKNYIG